MHQTGTAHLDEVRARYATLGVQAEVQPFIDDMAAYLDICDLIVCRAGAITVSELCAAGVASVLVPLVVSTTAHQKDNAAWMAERGAALHLPQADLTPQALAETLLKLDREQLLAMAQKAKQLARPHAAAKVADEIERLAS
jgi:UDP-N-acetylglucosamine--N-acetylmuramyl-(pentapeptide) pyrophosphoryl-undecaprenol N-acetylglucosamine transferase